MESITISVMQSLSGENLATMGKLIGTDSGGAQSILSTVVPSLVGALAHTTSQPGGATTLMNLIGGSKLENVADDIGGYLGNPDVSGGANILGQLLGNQQGTLTDLIARKTGFSPDAIGRVLAIITPVVMGFVGKLMQGHKMDAGALTSFLGMQSEMALENAPGAKEILAALMGETPETGGFLSRLKKLFVS